MNVNLEIDASTVQTLKKVIDLTASDSNTHGELSIPLLIHMLLEDVCLVLKRPGCWEAANMHSVLASHGYGL